MEPMQELNHPSDDQLASFLDPGLAPDELESLVGHLDACSGCAARLEKIEPAFSQYRHCLDAVHSRVPRRELDPSDLWMRMERLEADRSPQRFTPSGLAPSKFTPSLAWLSAIAAAVIVTIFLLPWGRGSEMRAETLLARASSSAVQVKHPSHLHIRTRSASFVRPVAFRGDASAEDKQQTAIREHFAAAHYDWADPLSSQAYTDWRHRLTHKTTGVSSERNETTGQVEQRIETTTADGELRDASLTLDAALAPVSGRFEFADREWVEITVAPDPPASPAPSVATASRVASPPPQTTPTGEVPPAEPAASKPPLAQRELSVRLAIDALDLGPADPIEVDVQPEGRILVTSYGLLPQVTQQLRARLDQIQGVTLRPAAIGNSPRETPPRAVDRADVILQASQEVSFEAHLLAELATRFEPSTEATLPSTARADLLTLRRKHSARMLRKVEALQRELESEPPGFHPASQGSDAVLGAPQMAKAATAVDRSITVLYAGKQPDAALARSWRELEEQFGALQSLARAYSDRMTEKQ
jgi:hypothetical protein